MASSCLTLGIARLFANVRSAAQLDRKSIAAFRIAVGGVLIADAHFAAVIGFLFHQRDFPTKAPKIDQAVGLLIS